MVNLVHQLITLQELIVASESLWSNAPPCFLAPALRSSFSISTPTAGTLKHMKVKKHVHRDAYTLRQAQQRKEANISRQALLKEQAKKELGDPIRGVETPFLRSFDSDISQDPSRDVTTAAVDLEAVKANLNRPSPSLAHSLAEANLDHGIDLEELQKSLRFSKMLTEPLPPSEKVSADREREAAERQHWESRNQTASEAVQRIISLANGSSMHRTKKNIERIISAFGRHNTDNTLKPKAAAKVTDPHAPTATQRAGPDTGSSEVQIGILTAKIRVLADRYQGEARQDKVNKRNLRLLLHRRQKLLKYMEKKERGSERWTNMIKTLGLTSATWRGEIVVE